MRKVSPGRKLLNGVVLVVIAGIAAGCGTSAPKDTYGLSLAPMASGQVARGRQLLITEPVALKTLDSDSIVIQVSQQEYQYLGESQWSDRLPKMVQVKLAQAFENSGKVGGAGLPGQGLAIDYQVQTNIHAFQIDADAGTAVVEIAVRILNDRNGTVRARSVFRSVVPLSSKSNKGYVAGLDRAFANVTGDMIIWVLRYI